MRTQPIHDDRAQCGKSVAGARCACTCAWDRSAQLGHIKPREDDRRGRDRVQRHDDQLARLVARVCPWRCRPMTDPTAEDACRVTSAALGGPALSARRFTTGLHHFVYEVELP